MASVVVHNGEHFERGKTRYIVFSLTLVILIVVSVLFENFFGAIILFLLVWGYILFALMRNKKIVLRTWDQGLVIADKMIAWSQLEGRSVEVDTSSWELKNIIILAKWDKLIFTLDDSAENIDTFTKELSGYLPLAENLIYSFTEKLIRKLKL